MTVALTARGLSVSYGGVQALTDVDLDVTAGAIVGLIGPNGAGKTTFIDALTGFIRCRGRIELDGNDVTGAPPHVRARRGLARTWQAGELFDDLTVAENLAVAQDPLPLWSVMRARLHRMPTDSERVIQTLERVGLGDLGEALPDELSQGQRKLVGVARALVGGPSVVLLDEPAAGLDTNESERLGVNLIGIARGGPGMLLVDHDMGLVLSVCDHVVVLNFGRVIAAGTPDAVRQDPAVISAYIGAEADDPSVLSRPSGAR